MLRLAGYWDCLCSACDFSNPIWWNKNKIDEQHGLLRSTSTNSAIGATPLLRCALQPVFVSGFSRIGFRQLSLLNCLSFLRCDRQPTTVEVIAVPKQKTQIISSFKDYTEKRAEGHCISILAKSNSDYKYYPCSQNILFCD